MKNHRRRSKRKLSQRARTLLLWGLLAFVGMQTLLAFVAAPERNQVCDSEYDSKLIRLRARVNEEPHRPLVLILGSSRSAVGIRPDACRLRGADDRSPLVFNFGITGAGPRQQLVILRRILAEGIRPAGVMIEVLPPILYQVGNYAEDAALKCRWMLAEDLAIQDRSAVQRFRDQLIGAEEWLSRLHASRFGELQRFAPDWVPGDLPPSGQWTRLDAWGWLPFAGGHNVATAEQYSAGVARARKQYEKRLSSWKVSDVSDRALRTMLKTCQSERMSVALYLMPEGSPFRSWYPPAVRAELENYLPRLCREHDARWLDATLWNADEDFWDGHHLLVGGATRFSERLGRELLEPIVAELNGTRVLSQRPTPERQ